MHTFYHYYHSHKFLLSHTNTDTNTNTFTTPTGNLCSQQSFYFLSSYVLAITEKLIKLTSFLSLSFSFHFYLRIYFSFDIIYYAAHAAADLIDSISFPALLLSSLPFIHDYAPAYSTWAWLSADGHRFECNLHLRAMVLMMLLPTTKQLLVLNAGRLLFLDPFT